MAQTSTDVLTPILTAIVRHFLSILAAWLISKGLVAPEMLSEGNVLILAGGVVAGLISVGWIIYNKLKVHNLVSTALAADPRTPIGIVKAEADAKPLTGPLTGGS